jgi:hypothetical protein
VKITKLGKFTVAMLSTKELEGRWITETLYLAPVVPQQYHTSYYALKKIVRSNKPYLWFKGLNLYARCERGGALTCL